MASAIYLKTDKVWAFWEKNKARLCKEMVLIAEDGKDTKIYLSGENNLPYVYAYKGERLIEKEGMVNRLDAIDTVFSYYYKYLAKTAVPNKFESPTSSSNAEAIDDDPDGEEESVADAIYEREDELYFAIRDFLEVALETTEDEINAFPEEVIDSILDDVLKLLAKEYEFDIYRPTIPENGSDPVINYPYSS